MRSDFPEFGRIDPLPLPREEDEYLRRPREKAAQVAKAQIDVATSYDFDYLLSRTSFMAWPTEAAMRS